MLVGLGNPGAEYRGTRHNVGFEVIDRLAERHKIKLNRSRHRAQTGLGKMFDQTVLLAKPLTYMNLSGQSVAPLARDSQLKPERVFVIADDLDLPVGKLKIRLNGSAGGHNGHKSIIASLRSDDYPRLKIGIGKVSKDVTADHVLSPFSREELDVIQAAIDTSVRACEELLREDIHAALRVVDAHNKARGL